MKKTIFIITILSLLFIQGCALHGRYEPSTNTDKNVSSNSNTTNISNETNNIEGYETYEGLWTLDGKSMQNSGAEFCIHILNGNELNGYIYTKEESFDRFAEIKNISGSITDGTCSYSFNDDGWGNSGTLLIQLKNDTVTVEVKDFVMNENNVIGYGISGTYYFIKVDDSAESSTNNQLCKYNNNWDDSQILAEIDKRAQNRDTCSFYYEYVGYMETVRNVTDISIDCFPLYNTDKQYYNEADFKNDPPLIIYLAKNEIYARHGYIFSNSNLNSFFLTQLWYIPEFTSSDFDDSVFNDYEKANLKLLSKLDTYK